MTEVYTLIFYFMEPKTFKFPLGNKEFIVETGKLAQQAGGSCTVRLGDTVILATATLSRSARPGVSFLPLMVNYQEKLYASGTIKGSRFIKRETRPSDDKILMSRVIDRTLRPLFPKNFHRDIQVMLTTLSYDRENEHDMVSAVAASIALSISEAPFEGPTATVRVGIINNDFVLNPTMEQRIESDLDLIVSSTKEGVVMIEAGANEVTEEKMLEGIDFGRAQAQKIVTFIEGIKKEVGKPMLKVEKTEYNQEVIDYVYATFADRIRENLLSEMNKGERYDNFRAMTEEAEKHYEGRLEEDEMQEVGAAVDRLVKATVRNNILKNGKRVAGRGLDEVRPISVEVGLLPRAHGSALFQRGETQGLSTCTLAGPGAAQIVDGIEGERKLYYFHHYNFPPFSVGETSNRLFTGNREVGHGALAQKAIEPMLPSRENFPYTIRTVTEILSSNGSSSMAATCGSSLALMSAGVPLKKAVGGIAMGLMTDHDDPSNYVILTDLQDEEDFGGDMDFKVTGTRDGITAIQMDIKLKNISGDVFKDAFAKAHAGRMTILDAMDAVISEAGKMSEFAPRLITLHVEPEKIRFIIGPGGEVINKIIDECGVDIDIDDDGTVVITTVGEEGGAKAKEWIEGIVADPEKGKIYKNVKVTKMLEFGGLVEFMPGKEGMVHVSEVADTYVEDVSKFLKEGQIVNVLLKDIDEAKGRYKLSLKGVEQPKQN
jgi:polyribonucleotide nucleotidyltransferase